MIAQSVVYAFDQLTVGPLHGQDNWSATANAVIESGAGIDTSLVFNNITAGLPQAAGSRVNDGQFSFPALNSAQTKVILGFDFRLKSPGGANCSADFQLAERDHGFTPDGKIGLRYDATQHQLQVIRCNGTGFGGEANNFPDVAGDWFRVRMVVDFSAQAGSGMASVFVQNLTAGQTEFSPVPLLQNISLLVASQGADPSQWDRMDIRSANIQMDNLTLSAPANAAPVPTNPALATLTDQPVSFSVAKLATDPDGDVLTCSVASPSAMEGTVGLSANVATYSPPAGFTGIDTFAYTADDGRGGVAGGTVTVTVRQDPGLALNVVFGPVLVGGQFVVRLAGVPGYAYTLERSADLTTWVRVTNVTAPMLDEGCGVGVIQFAESVDGATRRFYRTVYPAY